MPTLKPGKKQYQLVLDEASEVHQTLLDWAKKRGLTLGTAARVILADWSDAMNGKPNPFAMTLTAGSLLHPSSLATAEPQQELSAEERARQAALLQAAEQFM